MAATLLENWPLVWGKKLVQRAVQNPSCSPDSMADVWLLFASNARDKAASSDGGINARLSSSSFAIVVPFACRRPSPTTPPPPSSVTVVLLHCRTNSGRKDLPARSDFCYPWRHPTTCMLRFIIHAMYSVDALLLFFSPHKSSLDPVLAKNLR